MIVTEVLLCLAALLLLLFKHNVDGSQIEPLTTDETNEREEIRDYIESGETPVETQDLTAFIEEYEPAKEEADEIAPIRDNWRLILVNKQNPVPDDYELMLTDLTGNMQIDERIATDIAAMIRAAKDEGISLTIVSAYRDYERQSELFDTKVRRYMRNGMTYMDAYSKASQSVTVPGCSEHQLGLALDIVGSGHSSLTESFENTEAGKWLAKHCDEYGFILRYPKGKEYITGIIYEPWHFRYVGREAAVEIMGSELTLEEYLWNKGVE